MTRVTTQLEEQKRNALYKAESLQNDLFAVKETLNSARNMGEMQEFDMRKLQQTIEDYKNELNLVQREKQLVEDENRELKKDQQDLSDTVCRLERIVYGKTS